MEILYTPGPDRVAKTNMRDFMQYVEAQYQVSISDYDQLYQWSIDHPLDFWPAVWDYTGIISSRKWDRVCDDFQDMMHCRWFPGAQLNFAENLLRYRDDKTAIISVCEHRPVERITFGELYQKVQQMASAMRASGVVAGDRVAGCLPNIPEGIIAMLAAASIGAIWSSCSPDFGFKGIIDRFGQIEPRILFMADGYSYNRKNFDCLGKAAQLSQDIVAIEKVVIVPFINENPDLTGIRGGELYSVFTESGTGEDLEFTQLPFDHPLYIMYSSGTTGVPKCMVHGAGGTLIQHSKELVLHTNLTRDDTIFYFTTLGWMMWNWLVSSLAFGAAVLLYEGSPFCPTPERLWEVAASEGITIFGTSPRYLISVQKENVKPGSTFDLSGLRTVLCTGAPLPAESFEYVYEHVKQDLHLASISGGTDLISCFALGDPTAPVVAGELQCRGLGMKVQALDVQGEPLSEQKGELVCSASFPSRPVYFWQDPEEKKYKCAYYSVFPGKWTHGDFIEIRSHGGVVIYGRSDATLNPGGVRIGTAEIYRQVENMPEIADSLAIGQNWKDDVRVVLFVKMKAGCVLSPELEKQIKSSIRTNLSARHVPAKIVAVEDIPYTLNGKKVELAVKNIVDKIQVLNQDALINPEALEYYRDLPELQED